MFVRAKSKETKRVAREKNEDKRTHLTLTAFLPVDQSSWQKRHFLIFLIWISRTVHSGTTILTVGAVELDRGLIPPLEVEEESERAPA